MNKSDIYEKFVPFFQQPAMTGNLSMATYVQYQLCLQWQTWHPIHKEDHDSMGCLELKAW